jgi:hypothetical protein
MNLKHAEIQLIESAYSHDITGALLYEALGKPIT